MAEEDFPLGSEDSTVVTPTIGGYLLRKFRTAVSLADPYVLNARLRLASINGVYRLPASAVLVASSGSEVSIDSISASLTAIDTVHKRVHDGEGYTASGKATINDGGGERLFQGPPFARPKPGLPGPGGGP